MTRKVCECYYLYNAYGNVTIRLVNCITGAERGISEMLKKYYIKYKLKSLPTYWEFTCYAYSIKEARSAFDRYAEMSRVEDYYIAYVERA